MRKLLVLAGLVGLVALFVVAPSSADPTNAYSSVLLNVVCGGQPVTLVFNGNGMWSPGHDVVSNSVFNPTGVDTTITFTPANGDPPSVDHAIVDKNAANEDTIVCTIPLQPLFTNAVGSATIAGSVTGFWTPR